MPEIAIIMISVIVILIVLGVSINGIVSKVYAHQRWEKEGTLGKAKSSGAVSELADRTDLIEDRLRVLERLATDRGILLSDEIEALRETPALTANKAKNEGEAQ
ncbi:MAG: hypothetical protein AAF697_11420 [Pseudomonadota bacterium]